MGWLQGSPSSRLTAGGASSGGGCGLLQALRYGVRWALNSRTLVELELRQPSSSPLAIAEISFSQGLAFISKEVISLVGGKSVSRSLFKFQHPKE